MTSQEQENEDLRKAAYRGDVKFLRDSCVVYNKPHGYYLTVFQSNRYEYLPAGNIFHIGASANQVEFIREAIKLLASEVVQELIQTVNQDMENPLHCAAIRGNVEVIKMLLEIFPSQSLIRPWLDKDITGSTPCHRALTYGHEHCASEFLKKDKELLNMIDNLGISLLFRAASRRCNKVVLEILKSDHSFSTDGPDGQNAMEYLPRCSDDKEICRLFLIKKPELIYTKGFSILNTWAAEGKVWPFEHLLMCDDIIPNVKMVVFNIFLTKDPESGYNLLHTLALSSSIKESIQIAKLLMDVYKDETSNKEITTHASTTSSITRDQQSLFPWLLVSKSRITPLLAAIYSGNEDFASYILSLDNKAVIQSPFNCLHVVTMAANPKSAYRPEKNKLERFALEILEVLIKEGWTHLIIDGDEVVTMHNAPFCGDTELGTWLIDQTPEFITEPDNEENTPLDEAFAFGATWFIEHVLIKFPLKFDSATLSWVKACEQGKYETLVSFILQYPGDFRNLCIQKKISPLHHINKLRSLKEYESFVTISDMKGLINLQDSEKNTPLHKAIEKQNIHLAEALLGLEKTNYTIKNKEGKSAMDMLADKCNSEDLRWDEMCQRIEINPRINTSFFQQRTDLLEVRNSLFVVAALIATITFAAGFTLPGGLNQDTGEAMMVKKAAFLVFLMANTLGMCTSTLVLICLIWSLVQDKSSEVPLLLIEKSMYLLMLAICSTLLAFMTGVFVTISPQTLWPTIVVIVMSSFIAVLVERNLLQKVLRIRPTKQGGVREHQEHEIFRGVSIVDACSAFIKQFQFRRTRKNEEHEETPNLV
ncbi:uncharacterized protein LOC104889665 isoform X2 [Beta vulgaris subsp. vulgaris]|uniref:uncharacterized protein LOC104889665 isoform X2 n=1 Tax=Beta vulgaris subsp. vulgaris TaxID=3555 RepID=UPI0020375949|nr:uncharacterized protein LOC104889665 isoform X2 [Beta vulgaris subsp. vulgaris]